MEYKEQELVCPECGHKHTIKMYDKVNGTLQQDLKKQILKGEFFKFTCEGENCDVSMPMVYPCLYQDIEKGYMVWYIPGFDREHMEKIAAFNADGLLEEQYRGIHKQYKMRVVGNLNDFIEKILIFDEDMDDRTLEVVKVMVVAQLQQKYKGESIRAVYFEMMKNGYALTAMLEKTGPVTVNLEMEQYYKVYNREKDFLEKNTPEGFAVIQNKWGIEMFQKIMKKAMRSKGKDKNPF